MFVRVVVAVLALFLAGASDAGDRSGGPMLLPAAGPVWGRQSFTLSDPGHRLRIASATLETPAGRRSLDKASDSVLLETTSRTFVLCVECLHASKLTLRFTLRGGISPIVRTYSIVHMPIPAIKARVARDHSSLTFDARASHDPQGLPLHYAWAVSTLRGSGPTFTVSKRIADRSRVMLRIDNGIAILATLAKWAIDTKTNEPNYKLLVGLENDHLKCTGATIHDDPKDPPMLSPYPLGADLAVGQSVPLDASNATANSVIVVHRFEVHAKLVAATENLYEAQDIAKTMDSFSDGTWKSTNKRGKERIVDPKNPLKTKDVEVEAPFPNPVPDYPKQPLPTMVSDGYDFHPWMGTFYANSPTGATAKDSLVKEVKASGADQFVVTADTPGFTLSKGQSMGQAIAYHALFHTWFDPDKSKCDKVFRVDIEIDAAGKVTKNELKVLQ